MHTHSFFSIPGKLSSCFVILALALITTSSAAQDNTFSGTYTFLFASSNQIQVQSNMFGQEVGFCPNNGQIPFGYSCNQNFGQDVATGTIIADGKGNIIAGSNITQTVDPNSAQCSPKFNPAPDCPYKVPAGIAWSSTTSYVVGDEVDFTEAGKLLTFQAVKANSNVPPNTSTCTQMVQPPNCDWDQLFVSATGKTGFKGTVTGTYTVQSNGSAVSLWTIVTSTGKQAVSFAMVVPPAPLAIGQEIDVVGLPTLTNETRGTGAAVRVK